MKLVMIALLLHFLGSGSQIFVDNHVYHGVADFNGYVHQGATLSENFRSFHFTTQGAGLRGVVGDGSVSIAAGIVFSIVGVNELASFFVFAWFSWLGTIFFYRAFCLTFPEGGHRRYALMLFLLPSLALLGLRRHQGIRDHVRPRRRLLRPRPCPGPPAPGLSAHRAGHGHGHRHPTQ